jgi:hypothetical protein
MRNETNDTLAPNPLRESGGRRHFICGGAFLKKFKNELGEEAFNAMQKSGVIVIEKIINDGKSCFEVTIKEKTK